MLLSPLAEEKLLETSSDCAAIGRVQTPKDSLPKQVLESSKGPLDSAELLEGGCVPVALATGAMVGKGKLHQTPAQRTHPAHHLDTAVLALSPGFSFRHYMAKCETWPASEECLDRFRTIQCKKELHCPVHTSPAAAVMMQPAEIHCFHPMHRNTSVHKHSSHSSCLFIALLLPRRTPQQRNSLLAVKRGRFSFIHCF